MIIFFLKVLGTFKEELIFFFFATELQHFRPLKNEKNKDYVGPIKTLMIATAVFS